MKGLPRNQLANSCNQGHVLIKIDLIYEGIATYRKAFFF